MAGQLSWLEHGTHKPGVGSSILPPATTILDDLQGNKKLACNTIATVRYKNISLKFYDYFLNMIFFKIRKLLLFSILSVVLVSCNQNRNDEYNCKYDDNSGGIVNIKKDHIFWMKGKTKYKITKETSERILAERDIRPVSVWKLTFYKKTLKIKLTRFDLRKKRDDYTNILSCEKLN